MALPEMATGISMTYTANGRQFIVVAAARRDSRLSWWLFHYPDCAGLVQSRTERAAASLLPQKPR